jgi:signal peptidase II
MKKAVFVTAIVSSVVVLDQLTKWLVRREVPLHDAVSVVPGFFAITHASNPGGAFSLFAGVHDGIRRPFFVLVPTLAIGLLVYFVVQIPARQRWALFAVSGVLGGAIGNLIDRVAFGHVTDFMLLYWRSFYWPAFNVADSFISVGVTILILHSLFASDSNHESPA